MESIVNPWALYWAEVIISIKWLLVVIVGGSTLALFIRFLEYDYEYIGYVIGIMAVSIMLSIIISSEEVIRQLLGIIK